MHAPHVSSSSVVALPCTARRDPGEHEMPARGFRHEAVFYTNGDHGFIRETLPLIERALADDAPILAAVGRERAAALKDALPDDDATALRFLDMPTIGRNPARTLSIWQEFVDQNSRAPYALGLAEPLWPGRTAPELEECARHEALVNLAFAGGPAWRLLCPHDLDALPDAAIEAARQTHPLLACCGTAFASNCYAGSEASTSPFAGTLPAPAGSVRELTFSSGELASMRHRLGRWARAHALDGERVDELVLAFSELATNSISYGGGSCTLRFWREQHVLMCEVQDEGELHAPLAGRVRPPPLARRGRGLWLANQLCDLVQIRSASAASVVRIHMHLL